MKIRSLQLRDFRKFTGTFRVDGIGDGLNVLVGPNEYGKSTLLAAINGVIFEKATSQNERVKAFRHFTHGAVATVDLAFDLDGVRWTIQKRFAGQSGRAVLTNQNGRHFESAAAEAELQQLLGFERPSRDAEPGIWGTLWVQQGKSFGDASLDEFGRRSLEDCLEAQVGIVTGGQRGQRIPVAIKVALDNIKSTRGPRGRYKEAVDRLDQTKRQVDEYEKKQNELSAQTEELGRLRRERQRARADWDEPAHRQLLNELRDRRVAAATKAAETESMRTKAQQAAERAKQAQEAVDGRKDLIAAVGDLESQASTAAADLAPAQDREGELQSRVDDLDRSLAQLREDECQNNGRIRRLDRIRGALAIADEIRHHEATLAEASQLRDEVGRLSEAIGANPATDEQVSQAENASSELAAARAAAGAVATTLTFALAPGAARRVRLDGEVLASASFTVSAVTKRTIAIDGIGEIAIDPQIAEREAIAEGVRRAEADLAAALELVGAKNLSAARLARAERQDLVRQLASKQREIATLAPPDRARKLPAGLNAREVRLQELRGKLGAECTGLGLASLPFSDDVQKEISGAHREGEGIITQIDQIVAALDGPRGALAEAAKTVKKLENQLLWLNTRLEEKRGQLAASRARLGDHEVTNRAIEQKRLAREAQETFAARERDQGEAVGDIDVRIKRLEAAGRSYAEEVQELDKEIVRVESWIEANEGAGIEEMLDAERADEDRWQRAVKDYEEDTKVLELLRDTLRAAESEAKQR
jgi:energy-coupling factor transporter ATP-binding protein EcfA2